MNAEVAAIKGYMRDWEDDPADALELWDELPEPKRIHSYGPNAAYPPGYVVMSGGKAQDGVGEFSGFIYLQTGETMAEAITLCWLQWQDEKRYR